MESNLIQLKDICYEVIPGFLPETAIHEILSEHEENRDRTFQQSVRLDVLYPQGVEVKYHADTRTATELR